MILFAYAVLRFIPNKLGGIIIIYYNSLLFIFFHLNE